MAATNCQKTVLITGCSAGGIGASLAVAFLRSGYLVFATARDISKIPKSLTSHPDVYNVTLDVTSEVSVLAAVRAVEETLRERYSGSQCSSSKSPEGLGLDAVVNNSGAGIYGPILDVDIAEAEAMFNVNFFGAIRVLKAFAHLLVKQKGTLVNISSLSGELNDPWASVYNASKAALTVAGETWRLELEGLGVRVLTVATGMVASQFHDNTHEVNFSKESYYRPIKDIIILKQQGKFNNGYMDPDVYAERVVAAVNAGKTGKVYEGGMAFMVWLGRLLLPTWLFDHLMRSRGLGLNELKQARKGL